jgi:hypothetical protein
MQLRLDVRMTIDAAKSNWFMPFLETFVSDLASAPDRNHQKDAPARSWHRSTA